jgi:beta-glucosidase/6-phospho-beta-glucosidase/beta-galactosidase
MNMRFGLYAVDDQNPAKPRTARSVVPVYGRIAKDRRVPEDLARRYGAP